MQCNLKHSRKEFYHVQNRLVVTASKMIIELVIAGTYSIHIEVSILELPVYSQQFKNIFKYTVLCELSQTIT